MAAYAGITDLASELESPFESARGAECLWGHQPASLRPPGLVLLLRLPLTSPARGPRWPRTCSGPSRGPWGDPPGLSFKFHRPRPGPSGCLPFARSWRQRPGPATGPATAAARLGRNRDSDAGPHGPLQTRTQAGPAEADSPRRCEARPGLMAGLIILPDYDAAAHIT